MYHKPSTHGVLSRQGSDDRRPIGLVIRYQLKRIKQKEVEDGQHVKQQKS